MLPFIDFDYDRIGEVASSRRRLYLSVDNHVTFTQSTLKRSVINQLSVCCGDLQAYFMPSACPERHSNYIERRTPFTKEQLPEPKQQGQTARKSTVKGKAEPQPDIPIPEYYIESNKMNVP